jgi:signal peptidase I
VVLVDRRGLDVDDLSRGDLVTFASPANGVESLKRVVGLPGERVAVLDAVLHVDGRPLDEPYVDFREWDGMFTAQVTVPEDAVYVLGDDRLTSVDSRDFGPVPVEALDGRVLVRLWPPVRLGGEDPQPPQG